MTHGYIYFGGYGDAIKIGKSITPKKRIANINGANPDNVKLYASIETFDMAALETRMHQHFAYCRREGKREWYSMSTELLYVVKSLEPIPSPTEFDLGRVFGNYEAYRRTHDLYRAELRTTRRALVLAEHRQREQWAQLYAVSRMKFSQYPAYQFRYNEAMEYLKTLEPGDVPVFVTDQFDNLVIPQEDVDTQTDAA